MNRPRELHALVSPGKVCEEAAGITQDEGDVPIRESKTTRDVPVVQHDFGLNGIDANLHAGMSIENIAFLSEASSVSANADPEPALEAKVSFDAKAWNIRTARQLPS